MTSLHEALRDAGFVDRETREHEQEARLREIAMQALYAHPRDVYARRQAIMAAIGDDAALLRLLFARHTADAIDRLVAGVRNDMIVNQRTGRAQAETQRSNARAAALAVSGDRTQPASHAGLVPADRTDAGDREKPEARSESVPGVGGRARNRELAEAQSLHVPGAGAGDRRAFDSRPDRVPGVGAQAVAAVARLSLLDTFRVNGQPLGDVSAAEARLWAQARGRQARRDARFIELVTAGLPDGMPIRRFRRDDEAQAAWAQALQETV